MKDILDRNPHFRDKITGTPMVRMDFKPDRVAGVDVKRGVIPDTSGVNIQSTTILFPAKMQQAPPPIRPLDEQLALFMKRIITLSDQMGDPVIKAQAVTFYYRLERAARAHLYRAGLIERERIKALLRKHGMSQAVVVCDAEN